MKSEGEQKPSDILIDDKVKKRTRKLSRDDFERIKKAIEQLRNNPTPQGCIKLKGNVEGCRIRVGNYRILYKIKIDRKYRMIEVYLVLDRKEGYPLRM